MEIFEAGTGARVSTPENYLDEPESRKRLKRKRGAEVLQLTNASCLPLNASPSKERI
jgi:hypothetical protein